MRALVRESEQAWQALGQIRYGPTIAEKDSLVFRRSLYAVTDVRAGDEFTMENLRVIRPGLGLAPKYLEVILGKRAIRDVTKGTPLTWDLIG